MPYQKVTLKAKAPFLDTAMLFHYYWFSQADGLRIGCFITGAQPPVLPLLEFVMPGKQYIPKGLTTLLVYGRPPLVFGGMLCAIAVMWTRSPVLYTLGVVFFVWKRLPYHHAIWHLFVLAGSVCHFSCVLGYVIPPAI